jgi:type II secretory pathway component GspD/PulD (secretin)
LAPTSRITYDPVGKRLMVIAAPSEHEIIQKNIEQLEQSAEAEGTERLLVFPLKKADPAMTVATLAKMFPQAECTPDKKGRRIIVVTRQEDPEAIRKAVSELDGRPLTNTPNTSNTPGNPSTPGTPSNPGASDSTNTPGNTDAANAAASNDSEETVMVYTIEADPRAVSEMLQEVFPHMTFTADIKTGAVVVKGPKADQKTIAEIVERMSEPDEKVRPKVVAYSTGSANPVTLRAVIAQLIPKGTVSADTKTRTLVVLATPKEHEAIRVAIEKLAATQPDTSTFSVATYTMSATGAATAVRVLTAALPEAQLSIGADPRQLIAFARPDDQAVIKSAVEQMEASDANNEKRVMAIYSLPLKDVTAITQVLDPITLKNSKITPLPNREGLLVWAEPKQQEVIKKAVEDYKRELPNALEPTTKIYRFSYADPKSALVPLTTLVPNAKIALDIRSRALVVSAMPEEHEKFAAAIKEMDREEGAAETAPRVATYMLSASGAATAVRVLTTALPEAQLSIGTDPRQLVAFARPADQAVIKAAVEQMEADDARDEKRVMVVYPMPGKDATAVMQVLDPATLKNAKITPLPNRDGLLVWADPKQQELIKKSLDDLKQELPKAIEPTTKIYRFSYADPKSAIVPLTAMVPTAKIALDVRSRALMVSAMPEEHEKFAAAIKELDREDAVAATAPTLVTYTLSASGAATAVRVLTVALPEAQLSIGTDPRQLVAFARPADQAVIKAAVEQMEADDSHDDKRVMVVYPMPGKDATAVMQVLDPATLKNAKITPLPNRDGLLVWADPKQQELIKKSLDDLKQELPKAIEPTTKIYRFSYADPKSAIVPLTAMVPTAKIALDVRSRALMVSAMPDEHEKFAAAIKELDREDAATATAPTLVTYTLSASGAATAVRVLTVALPEAQLSIGTDPRQLVAFARPADQAVIKAAVEQMEADDSHDDKRVMAVYPMPGKDATAVMQVLDPATLKNAKITPLPNRDGLLVWADPKQQELIKKSLDDLKRELPKASEPTTKVYRFVRADAKAAVIPLTALLPTAKIALDAKSQTLIVSATPEDHVKVASAVAEMDREDSATGEKLQVHRITASDPQNMLLVLQGLFKGHTDVQIALDSQHDAIVAVATPEEHKIIDNLIQQVQNGVPGESGVTLELYSLQNIEGRGIVLSLTKLLEKHGGKVDLSIEPLSRQLTALAKPEQHKILKQTLENLRGGQQTLEILQLESLEPSTAERAIRQLFSDDTLHAPEVEIDYITEQLFVRGTPEQLTKIRELLAKLGETRLAETPSKPGTGPIRTIPFHGDAKAMVEELQRTWPQLSKNPMQVVAPSAIAPLLRKDKEKAATPPPTTPAAPATPATPVPAPAGESKQSSWNPAADIYSLSLAAMLMGQAAADAAPAQPAAAAPAPAPEKPAAENAAPQAPAASAASTPAPAVEQKPVEKPAEKPVATDEKAAAPVLIAQDGDNIVIASNDPAALDQLESILHTMSQSGASQSPTPGRNYSIYLLKHAVASRAAETLQSLFRSGKQSGSLHSTNSVIIVADERTNAVLVQASRTDRAVIENYLKIIDTDEMPVALNELKPLTVVLQNAKASRIEQLLRTIFKSQLGAKSTTGSQALVSTDITVDEVTNSLIITAPSTVAEHLASFARSLDESSAERSNREVSIIPLKKTNAARVQQILEMFLDDAPTAKRPRAATTHRP